MNVLFIKKHYVYADGPAEVADGYWMKQRLSFTLLRRRSVIIILYQTTSKFWNLTS